jgi:hypothetical protein
MNLKWSEENTKRLPVLFIQYVNVDLSFGVLLIDNRKRGTNAYATVIVEFIAGLKVSFQIVNNLFELKRIESKIDKDRE